MRVFTLIVAIVALFFLHDETSAEVTKTYTTGVVSSYSTTRFDNENLHTLPHPKVISFSIREDGSAFGLTETGVVFSQYNVPNTAGIRVQRFEIDAHFHYIIEGEPVYSFTEFSARLALAYTVKDTH